MKTALPSFKRLTVLVLIALAFSIQCSAFSLLGPNEPWMGKMTSFQFNEIGAPMDLRAGYRWNIPVITYGFDQSFIDYFGTNGVAQVESAIGILNALPASSSISLNDFPLQTKGFNFQAQAQSVLDLKSVALSLLLEQMGLTSPFTGFALRDVVYTPGTAPVGTIVLRNYDPETLAPTNRIDNTAFTNHIIHDSSNPLQFYVVLDPIDPNQSGSPAIAGNPLGLNYNVLNVGDFYALGLTRDDVGGLRFLLSGANTNVESLVPNVYGIGANQNNFVNIAIRPGVEKITFIPHSRDSGSGAFLTMTNQFTDTYIVGGVTNHQTMERVISKPDLLFTMGSVDYYERTGPTNWINNATLNANQSGAGPGVIPPGAVIKFNRMGSFFRAFPNAVFPNMEDSHWATFDGTGAPVFNYPVTNSVPGTTEVRIQFLDNPTPPSFTEGETRWTLPPQPTPNFILSTSTDLTNWTVITNFPNNGLFHSCFFSFPSFVPIDATRFFRLMPSPAQ